MAKSREAYKAEQPYDKSESRAGVGLVLDSKTQTYRSEPLVGTSYIT